MQILNDDFIYEGKKAVQTCWALCEDLKKQHITLRSNEIQEQMIIHMHQSGKGYEAVSESLGLQLPW